MLFMFIKILLAVFNRTLVHKFRLHVFTHLTYTSYES